MNTSESAGSAKALTVQVMRHHVAANNSPFDQRNLSVNDSEEVQLTTTSEGTVLRRVRE